MVVPVGAIAQEACLCHIETVLKKMEGSLLVDVVIRSSRVVCWAGGHIWYNVSYTPVCDGDVVNCVVVCAWEAS